MIKINCDLCGKTEKNLNTVLIEGVELNVCQACSKFGKIITKVHRPSAKEQHKQYIKLHEKNEARKRNSAQHGVEKIQLLVEDYADVIKKRRESMGLTQKDFAIRINEKESTIHHFETGKADPPLELARKLEKFLGVRLVEEHEERHEAIKKQKELGFTLGDFIKVR